MHDPAMGIGRGSGRSQASGSGGRDPNAMDVDATTTGRTNTREEFMRRMRGRCYGCGGTNHAKRECNRARNVTCNYCRRRGHLEKVCQDKFMGMSRGRGLSGGGRQQVAATNLVEENFSLFNEESSTSVASTSTSPQNGQAQLVAQMAQLTNLLSNLSSVVNKPQD